MNVGRIEQLTHEEAAIVDNVRNIVKSVTGNAQRKIASDLAVELEQVYHLLDGALNDMMYAQNQGQVHIAVEQARDQIYRLLR